MNTLLVLWSFILAVILLLMLFQFYFIIAVWVTVFWSFKVALLAWTVYKE